MKALAAVVIALALVLVLTPFWAVHGQTSFQSCIDQTQSWNHPFSQGSLKSVTYIVSVPAKGNPGQPDGVALGWLIGLYAAPGDTEILVGVTPATANRFQGLSNGDTLFSQVRTSSHEMLLSDGTLCPILAEDAPYSATGAALWSR